ncbi:MAG: hypothetical protein H0V89_06130 [Deltaproteobacteria bacterium]|nr:hypothetical protein [Deltaproteobacteria bacterium]
MRGPLAAWFTVLVGCGPSIEDPEAFAHEFAGIWCDREETCALGDFEDEYDSFDQCLDDRSDDPNIHDSDKDGCAIDVDAANACLAFLDDAEDCSDREHGDIEEACKDVYIDCD